MASSSPLKARFKSIETVPATQAPAPLDAREKGGIQSIERAFSILEMVAQAGEGITLSELGRALGLHTSTAFHLIKTMLNLDYIVQDPRTKRYRLGNRALRLVGSAGELVDVISKVEGFVGQLAATTGENAHFAVRTGSEVHVVVRADGQGAFRLTERMGMARPAHATAIGKILLAFLPADVLDQYLQTATLAPFTENTIVDPDVLRTELARVKTDELAFDDKEFHLEVRCVAVPVRDFRRQVVGALGISGPTWHLPLSRLNQHVAAVKDVANLLSREFGKA